MQFSYRDAKYNHKILKRKILFFLCRYLLVYVVMKGFALRSSTGLIVLVLSLSCTLRNHWVVAAPQPEPPAALYKDSINHDIPSQSLVDRLKNFVEKKDYEKELMNEVIEEQTELQELIESKKEEKEKNMKEQSEVSEEDTESLPVPAAVSNHAPPPHPAKRGYIQLCHFKICNMGRRPPL
ncbi:hypothetical protein QAD02_011105 [Eretmocerus hayati]|uniref:Uncharacterized protein n=1 Tax=Eretmocerus hayati TaxID=131215 RepID=A0ACC2NYG3_9HYME|nr:hypothetical protein QAD02_011105 [Eretmocerus hayati]